jgi:F-type H+-transporting ATPase subunit c
MTKKLFTVLALMLLASTLLCAQPTGTAPAADNGRWLAMGAAAIAMAIASSLCGLAQGKATASAAEGMARNPGAAAAIRLAMIIGLAFIESLALYTLIIVFSVLSK